MIHLDTTFVVDLMREARRRKPAGATRKLAELANEELGISLFVLCELEAGAASAENPEAERARILGAVASLALELPEKRFAEIYGGLLANLGAQGKSIATMNLLIASAALASGAPLVTRNHRHFDRVPGLEVIRY